MHTFFLLPMIMMLISLTAPGPAQTPQGPPGGRRPPAFADVDKNGDGRISREEWQGPSEVFDQHDTNQDSSINQDEFKAGPRRGPGGPPGEHLLTLLDSNADGKVSQSEFVQITQLFEKLDQNGDGSLASDELERLLRGPRNLQIAGTRPAGLNPGSRRNPPDFAGLDTNGDKKISREEWHGPPQLFDQLDSSANGAIEESEWSARQNRMQPPPGGGFGGRILKFLDGDGDQKVSQGEFSALTKLFSTLDADHDGLLTREEIAGFFQAVG